MFRAKLATAVEGGGEEQKGEQGRTAAGFHLVSRAVATRSSVLLAGHTGALKS